MKHIPVLLTETIEALQIRPDGVYVDATLGFGGHAEQILSRLTTGMLIGIDQDSMALEASRRRLARYEARHELIQGNFSNLSSLVRGAGVDYVDGILMDIGVSSPQIDTAERGFSYMADGPLDMRMNPQAKRSAADIVASATVEELEEIFWKYGEERWGRRIAQRIVREREEGNAIDSTVQLANIVAAAVPSRSKREGHPAKRVFQALRMVVNDELGALEKGLTQAIPLLNPGGRLCVITFHSLEDRMVKQFYAAQNRDCICPSDLPICICDHRRTVRIITRKPIVAAKTEQEENPRARSAKLRVCEKME